MITYCPSCHTHFRVHAEQLAARAGQVRCGKCSRVFDALEHLIEETAPLRSPRPKPGFEARRDDAADADTGPQSAARLAADNGAIAPEHTIAQTGDVATKAPDTALMLKPAYAAPANAESVTASGAGSFDFGPVAAAEPAASASRWAWIPATLLLLILLAQAAYHYRGAIALVFPEIRPYAAALCATLGCELPLPRRVELTSIEASDLQADTTNPNVMVLSATLKNRAIFNQQHPMLELTLTDPQDRAVVRRVLAPRDYLGKAVDTQTAWAANTEIAIKVFIEGSQVNATGYRLYLFYP
jgi:predicted Zn finger-like uncharacterized protein